MHELANIKGDDGGLRELALFAGAGGGILGGKLLGWRTVCAVEWDAYAASVLVARQNDGCLSPFPIWDDVQTFDGRPWRGRIDVVSGGFPCQDISAAGKGAGIEGERSGMWFHMARIIGEVRPRFAFVENSPMLTSRGLGRVLGDLAEMGHDARWGVLGSCDAGLPTKRDRLWIVASAGLLDPNPRKNEGRNREEILLRKWASDSCQRVVDFGGVAAIEVPERASVDYGMADWMDELKAIGNGQSPALVELAWETLTGGI
jgi:DNA (cytosine-5)-methyltransferase 1